MQTSINRIFFSKGLRLALVAIFSFLMAACSENHQDLEAWVETIKAKPPGRIEPMPDIKEYKPHDYSSAHLRSPFALMQLELEQQLRALHEGCDDSIRPDPDRRREDLERYSLDSMEMVGTLTRPDKQWGLIKMTAGPISGNVVKVQIGDYLGIHQGRIVDMSDQQIEITTLVPDSQGCWEQRTVYLTLTEG